MKNITIAAILAAIIATTFALVVNNKANNYKAEAAAYKQTAEFYSQKSDKYKNFCSKMYLTTLRGATSTKECLEIIDTLSALNSESCPVAVILNK